MRKLKKIWRLSCLVLMIVLASIGVGISGGVPIPSAHRKEDLIEINIESDESKNDETNLKKGNVE